ncbi:MAG TPA: DUF4276 family protein, partial [Methanocorpusculum sp.]|nr:DUF4276 family protein [Methanocorpusculum sp.]
YAPEEINTSPETAPSKRLKKLYPHYSKTVEGMAIAERIGLAKMRKCCPHFNAWITELEQVATSRREKE